MQMFQSLIGIISYLNYKFKFVGYMPKLFQSLIGIISYLNVEEKVHKLENEVSIPHRNY